MICFPGWESAICDEVIQEVVTDGMEDNSNSENILISSVMNLYDGPSSKKTEVHIISTTDDFDNDSGDVVNSGFISRGSMIFKSLRYIN